MAKNPLFAPGICTRCGNDSPNGRNSIGECNNCHNEQWKARDIEHKAKLKARSEEGKRQGREYWQSRNIEIGQTLQGFFPSFLGIGGEWFEGIAKIGTQGAYVLVGNRKADPDYFGTREEYAAKAAI